jgi:phosphatidylinositol alpha-mannosyltransferase
MKIGIVLPYSITKGGGVRTHVLETQAELIRRGHDVLIITPQPRGHFDHAPKGVVFLGGSTNMMSPTNTVVQISASGDVDRIHDVLEEQQFDLLHFHEPWVPILSRQILARSNTVNVATFHAKMPDTAVSKTLERVITPYTKSILKYIDEMTIAAPPSGEYISQLTDKPLNLVPNGINLRQYKTGKLPLAKDPTIFYIGRLEKRKGVKYLLQAFSLVEQQLPNAKLIIAGDGPDRKKLELLAVQLGIKNVSFFGYVDDEEKIKHLQTCTVFCAPSMYGEAFGIVILEALACGAPVVAGANPGYAYALTGRGTLGLVNPYDTTDFARRLMLHLTDPDIRGFWHKWSKEHVKQYDYRNIVDKYEAVYAKAVKEHGGK